MKKIFFLLAAMLTVSIASAQTEDKTAQETPQRTGVTSSLKQDATTTERDTMQPKTSTPKKKEQTSGTHDKKKHAAKTEK
jgi:hypothetical protein